MFNFLKKVPRDIYFEYQKKKHVAWKFAGAVSRFTIEHMLVCSDVKTFDIETNCFPNISFFLIVHAAL